MNFFQAQVRKHCGNGWVEFHSSSLVSHSKSGWMDLAEEKKNDNLKGRVEGGGLFPWSPKLMHGSCAAVIKHYRALRNSGSMGCKDIITAQLSLCFSQLPLCTLQEWQKLCNKIQRHTELEASCAICPMAPFWLLDPYAMRFSIWHKKI